MTLDDLMRTLKAGDEITATLGRKVVVGSVSDDGWIEPEGADDYTWWIPIRNVAAVNGQPIELEPPAV